MLKQIIEEYHQTNQQADTDQLLKKFKNNLVKQAIIRISALFLIIPGIALGVNQITF